MLTSKDFSSLDIYNLYLGITDAININSNTNYVKSKVHTMTLNGSNSFYLKDALDVDLDVSNYKSVGIFIRVVSGLSASDVYITFGTSLNDFLVYNTDTIYNLLPGANTDHNINISGFNLGDKAAIYIDYGTNPTPLELEIIAIFKS